ncbi:MAG: hypothetical protein ACFFF4_06500 [Candidatus Thorarchaeota archaeon]
MTTTAKSPTINNMTTTQMLSLWWQEKWVRGLVLALSPIGVVDAIFTLLLFQVHGPDFEYNPIVRLALTSDWWFVWIIIDVFSFVIFAMLAGSYYIHTRSSIFGNNTGWLAGLIALRVGIAVYNVFLYFNDIYPIFWGAMVGFFSFIGVNRLLNREKDISVQSVKRYWRAKYDRLHDRFITRGLEKREDKEEVQEMENIPVSIGVWLKRAGFISMAIIVFVSIPFILVAVGSLTGALGWTAQYGNSFFWNEVSATAFLTGFFTVIILISIMMYFIIKSFTTRGGAW